MLDHLRALGITPTRASAGSARGPEWNSPCPECGGDDRFHVWPEQNGGVGSYWCRRCGAGGDLISFLRRFSGLTFAEAAVAAGRSELLTPGSRPPRRFAPHPQAASGAGRRVRAARAEPAAPVHPLPATLWREKFGLFVERAAGRLAESPAILAELAARGIDAAAATCARLGWNPGDAKGRDLYRERAAWGCDPAQHPDGRRKRLWLPVGLVIPTFNAEGALIRVRIRRPHADRGPRYYVCPNSGAGLMLIAPARRALIIVESELDAIMLAARVPQIGALGLGSAQNKPDAAAAAVLGRKLAVLVALDADAAGDTAATYWLQKYPRAVRLSPDPHKDPGEAYAAGVDLNAWAKSALPPALTLSPRPNLYRAPDKAPAPAVVATPVPEVTTLPEAAAPVDDWEWF